MCSVTEKPTADDFQPQPASAARVHDALLGPRRRKETLLPEITRMALEGHASQAIADKLGIPKRTVNHWLQEARKEWIATAAQGSAELFAADLARIDATYREAMEAWRKSQTDKEVRTVQHTESADGKVTTRTSIRTQTQCGTAAYLTRAMAAALASWRLKGKPGLLGAEAAAPPATTVPATKPTDDETLIPELDTVDAETVETEKARLELLEKEDLEEMSHEELRNVAEGLKCVVEADGGTAAAEVVDQDVDHMNEDPLCGYRSRLFAAIESVGELDAFQTIDSAEESQPGQNSSKFGQKSPVGGAEESQPGRNSSKFGQKSPVGGVEESQPGRDSSKFGQKSPVGGVGKPDIVQAMYAA